MITPIFFNKQKDAFEYSENNNHSFFFSKDLSKDGSKCYSSFPTSSDFIDYYLTIPDAEKYFNELIKTDNSFYEYYDLDLKLPPEYDISIYNNESLFIWFDNIRIEFVQSLSIDIDINKFIPKWVITVASNKTKLSLHLLNQNTIFTSHSTFKQYYSLFKTHIQNFVNTNHPFSKAIDFCVSSNNRCMRICLSSKIDSYRPLKIWNTLKDFGDLKYLRSIHKNPSLIDTLITNAINDPLISQKEVLEEDINKTIEIDKNIKNEEKTKPKVNQKYKIDHSNDLIENLLSILSKDRCDSYDDWTKIGMILKNKDENLFDLWDKWSAQSSKYTSSSSLRNIWDKFSNNYTNPLTLGTLHFLAKQDNPEKYIELISKNSHKFIDLPFTPTQTINHKYIDNNIYKDNIYKDNYDVIALKSNMNTGKTYGMPIIFDKFHRILVIYHRISLNLSIYEKWKEYGFELYSDITQHKINLDEHPRVICQLDSTHRLIGKCDLLILDEIESTHEHLCGSNTLNEKDNCSKTLLNYIKYTPKIIACDANIKDETCDILFGQKNILKIENTHKSFSHRSANIYHSKESLIEKLYELIELNKNIIIPTNSKTQAKKIEKLLSKKYNRLKILRIDSENGFIPIEEWNRYNIVIHTPTITCGVSFDETHFHSLVGFFSNKSASAEQCSQMFFRVRNLIDNNLFIYVDNDKENPSRAIDDLSLNKYIQNIIFNSPNKEKIEGFEIDQFNKKVIETSYFKLYRLYLKKINLSYGFFGTYITQILREHGLRLYHISPKVKDYKVFHSITDSLKEAGIEIKQEEAENIVNAKTIDHSVYISLIESKMNKDKDEMYSIKRYILTKTFDRDNESKLDVEWVKHNINYYNGYKHFKIFKDESIVDSIEKCKEIINNISDTENNKRKHKLLLNKNKNKLNKSPYSSSSSDEDEKDTASPYKRKNISKKIHFQIHYDKTFHKIYHCLMFIKEAGFKSINDTDKIKIDYSGIHRYCKENQDAIRAVFERSKIMVWSDDSNNLSPNEKNALSKYINQKLESCLSIRISKQYKGRTEKYEISKLFIL